MSQKDYYQLLGLNKDASRKAIKQAYRKLAFEYHPDKNNDSPAAIEKMKELNEAYATLSDPAKRQEYDDFRLRYGDGAYDQFRQTHSQEDIFRGSDINQVLNDLAKMYGFRGADAIFNETYGPGFRSFQFHRGRLFGEGFMFYQSAQGSHDTGSPTLEGVKNHAPSFIDSMAKSFLQHTLGIKLPEKGKDLIDKIALSQSQAETAGEIEYIHKGHGKVKKLMVKIPPAIKNRQRIRLSGMGAPGKNGGAAGDMYLVITIKTSLMQRVKTLVGR